MADDLYPPMTPEQGLNQALLGLEAVPPDRADAVTATATRLDGSTNESALVVEHLSKRFGSRAAFDDVSFEVGYGEVFGFLGPNGAGKTTTVRTLGTLLAPTSGSATVAGIELTSRERPGDPVPDLDHARVPRPVPAPHGGREPRMLCPSLPARRPARRASSGRFRRSTWPTGPTISAARSPRVSDSGSALARALLNDPAVLFLDEPTSGLDPVATREVHELIDGAQGPRRDDLLDHAPPRGGRAAL